MNNIGWQPSLAKQSPVIAVGAYPQSPASTAADGQAPDFGDAYAVSLSPQGRAANDKQQAGKATASAAKVGADAADGTKKADGTTCQTCASRRYQDGSNDANVSFKAPGHIAPESSASVVAAHEQEHVRNAQAEGSKPNKELISSSVRLFTATCPECGRTYTAGGETTTVMKTTEEKKSNDEDVRGKNVDIAA